MNIKMTQVILQTFSNKKQNILEGLSSIELSTASGQAKLNYNTTVKHNKRKTSKPKRRPKSVLKNANDWNRLYRKAVEAARNNFFVDNLVNTWYITLTIKDPHIKEVNTVRKWIQSYEKSFSKKVFILGFIELNKYHHPHVHMLMTTIERSSTELISESEVKNNWKYGLVRATTPSLPEYYNSMTKYHNNYIRRLINYSIKTWSSGSKLFINHSAINKYELITKRLKRLMTSYSKRITMTNSPFKLIWREKYKNAHSLYLKAKSKYKRELQKQVTVKDKPLYISYGKQKPVRIDNPSKKEEQLIKDNFELQGTRSFTLRKINDFTGEITNELHRHTEYYCPK